MPRSRGPKNRSSAAKKATETRGGYKAISEIGKKGGQHSHSGRKGQEDE